MSMFSTGLADDMPQWTTEVPTEPGHYWVMLKGGYYFVGSYGPHHARVTFAYGVPVTYVQAVSSYQVNSEITRWMRIQVPEAPK